MSRARRGGPAGDAYLDLQNQARKAGKPTQELLQLYILEGFLSRLAHGSARDRFVLKGGVLLAAFDARRPTKDVDLAGLNFDNDTETVMSWVRKILTTELILDDGIEFSTDSATAEIIREEDHYSGVRISIDTRLATAYLPFHVDVNLGDPIWPNPVQVLLPRLLGGDPIELLGYPIHMVLAEKIVTAIQRGTANTRWRDFGDIWDLSHRHSFEIIDLRRAIDEVAKYRKTELRKLAQSLDGFAVLAQSRWSAWRRRSNSDRLPEDFNTVITAVIEFADPALTEDLKSQIWNPMVRTWLE